MIAFARPFLERTTVIDPSGPAGVIDQRRTSLGMFVPLAPKDQVIRRIEKRISQVTCIPEEHGESIQILYYSVGAEYQPHFDYFDPATPGGLAHFNRGGQRVATFLVYLNTPEEGGETIFPRAMLKVAPKKGTAVLFYNVDGMGMIDPMSFHGGAPVISGEKWLLTRWLRERPFR